MDDFDKQYEAALADFDKQYGAAIGDQKDVPHERLLAKEGMYQPQLGRKPLGELPKPSVIDMIKRMGAQGLTLGAADDIVARAKTEGEDPEGMTAAMATAKGIPFKKNPKYRQEFEGHRQAELAKDKAVENAYPIAAPVTEVLSSLPTTVIGGPVKGAKDAFRAGGIIGGILGANKSEGKTGAEIAPSAAGGGILGALLGLGGYGISAGAEAAGTKAADVGRNLGWLLGGRGAPSTGRTLDYVGVSKGSPANEEIATMLENKVMPPQDFPPSVMNKASENAPSAVAKMGSDPRIKVAEKQGIQDTKSALAHVEEMPWANDAQTIRTLIDLRRGILPPESGGIVNKVMHQFLRPGAALFSRKENAIRALNNPELKAEMLKIIAEGRQPDLSSEASNALSSRLMSLLSD